jgi:hypothetical protein
MARAGHQNTVIGVFETPEQARRAVEELHRAGFGDRDITVMMHHHHSWEGGEVTDLDAAKAAQLTGETKAEKGAVMGAVTGGLLGGALSVASVLIPGFGPAFLAGTLLVPTVLSVAGGVAGGAAAGGLVGALIGLDIPEAEAQFYERELKAGRILVGVRAGDRAGAVTDLLRACGASEAATPQAHAAPAEAATPGGTATAGPEGQPPAVPPPL